MTNETTETKKTCDQLISERLESRLADLLKDTSNMDDAQREEHQDELHSGVLGVTRTYTIDVLLSWGGPSDGFEFDYRDGELVECRYYYKDWFDGASRVVDEVQADELAELFGISYEGEAASREFSDK